MLQMRRSLAVAAAVLATINTLLDDSDNDTLARFSVEAYANGREHGYCIKGWNPVFTGTLGIAFSECRSSDSIVVYCGTEFTDFQMGGNIPSERVWRDAKYFDYGEYQKAAEFILEKMRSFADKFPTKDVSVQT